MTFQTIASPSISMGIMYQFEPKWVLREDVPYKSAKYNDNQIRHKCIFVIYFWTDNFDEYFPMIKKRVKILIKVGTARF